MIRRLRQYRPTIVTWLVLAIAVVSMLIARQQAHASHTTYGHIRYTHPAATYYGTLNTAWHASGNFALDWDNDPPTDYWTPFSAYLTVFGWHDSGQGGIANTDLFFQGPDQSPSGCHEFRQFIYNIWTWQLEGEFDLMHVSSSVDLWWPIYGEPNWYHNWKIVGTTTTWDGCPWAGTHIHETHRNTGGGQIFAKNTYRFDCTCDYHADWTNFWSDWTRELQYW